MIERTFERSYDGVGFGPPLRIVDDDPRGRRRQGAVVRVRQRADARGELRAFPDDP
jgi:hypothetical protein